MSTKRSAAPPMEFDGTIFWYLERYDPAEDRCCICRELIPDDDVPLILWKKTGRRTLMARIHWKPCVESLMAAGVLQVKDPYK
jgi:hypothetical protein